MGCRDTCCSCWLLLGSEHGLIGKSISASCCLEHVQPIAVRWDQQYDSSESCAQGMCVPRSHTPAWCCIPKMIKCASRVPAVWAYWLEFKSSAITLKQCVWSPPFANPSLRNGNRLILGAWEPASLAKTQAPGSVRDPFSRVTEGVLVFLLVAFLNGFS